MDTDHIDFERQDRLGFPEFVFGEAKTVDQIAEILGKFRERGASCLVTRNLADGGLYLKISISTISFWAFP